MGDSVEMLGAEDLALWQQFVDGLTELTNNVFSEHGGATIVVGAQFSQMGQDESQPRCLVTGNIPVCAVGQALADMVDETERQHRRAHGLDEDGPVEERVSLDQVPEEVRQQVLDLISNLGVNPDQVTILRAVDTSDLDELPTTVEGTDAD